MEEVRKQLIIPKEEAQKITKLLTQCPENEEECFGKLDRKFYTVKFDDGIEMIIRICGVPYIKEGDNRPHTNAALLKDNETLCEMENGNGFFCEWRMQYKDTVYVAEVFEEGMRYREVKIKNFSSIQFLSVWSDIRLHIQQGGRIFLIAELENNMAVISISEDPVGEICTIISMDDIE